MHDSSQSLVRTSPWETGCLESLFQNSTEDLKVCETKSCWPVCISNTLIHSLSSFTSNKFIKIYLSFDIWATSWQNQQNDMCAQQRLRSAWASAQSDQSLLCAQLVAKDPMFLHADSEETGQSESSLGAHTILLVLSWGGSYLLFSFVTSCHKNCKTTHCHWCVSCKVMIPFITLLCFLLKLFRLSRKSFSKQSYDKQNFRGCFPLWAK